MCGRRSNYYHLQYVLAWTGIQKGLHFLRPSDSWTCHDYKFGGRGEQRPQLSDRILGCFCIFGISNLCQLSSGIARSFYWWTTRLARPENEHTLAHPESPTDLLRAPSLRPVRFDRCTFTSALCQPTANAQQPPMFRRKEGKRIGIARGILRS